ncbi:protein PFC0760c [Biomphalaria glabrata]|nr:protein PFC0760c [Biomphalaria glabrata]
MAVYHDPDLRIPRRRLAPHRIYHFNVIYNHGTGSDTGDQTSDMELALRVTRALVSRLEMKGYVNSYYHHRDFRRLNRMEAELDRVLRGSSVTVLILTPDFLPKCRQLYLRSGLFSRLIGEPRTRRRLLNLSVGVSRSQVPPELTPDDVLYFGCDWELDIPVWDRIEDIVETISNCSYDHLREDHHTYDNLNVTSADFSADHRFPSYKTSTSPCRGDNYLGEDQTWQTSVDTSTGFVPLDIENDSLECEDSWKEDYFARSPTLSVSRDELNQWCYGKGNQSMAKTFSDERSKIIGYSDVWPPVSRVYDIHGTVEILDCSHSEKSTQHGFTTLEQRLNRISDCLCECCIETDLEPSIRDENVKSRDINACHKQSYRNRSHTRQRFKHEFSESLSSEWSACKETVHTTDNDFNRSSFKSPSADDSKRGHSKQRTHEADVEHTGNLEEELNRWTSADKWTKWTQDLTKETSPITLSTEKPTVDFNNPISLQTAEKKTYSGKNYETMHLFHSTSNVKRTHDRNNTNKSNTHLIDSTFETSLPPETDRLHTDTDYSLYESSYTSSYNKQFLNRRTCDSFNVSSLDSQLGLMESSRSSLLFKDLNLDSTASYAPVPPRGIMTPSKFRLFQPATALRYEQQTTRGFEDSCYNNRSCSSARDPARASAGKYREGRVPILRGTNSVRLSGVVSHVGDSQYKTDYQQDKYNSPLSDSRIHEPSRSALSEANWSSQSPHYLFREFKNADWTRHHNQPSTDSSNSQGYLPFSSTDTLPNRYHDYSFNDFYETYKDFQVPDRNVETLPATQKTQSHDHHYSTKSDDVIKSKGTSQKAWLDSDNISMNNRLSRPNRFTTFTLENLGDQDTSSRLWDNVDTTFESKHSFTTDYENQGLKKDEPMFSEHSKFIAEATTSLTSPESRDFNENKTFVGWTDTDFTEGDTFSLYESEDRATRPSRHLSNPALGLWQADKSLTQMHGAKTERDTGSTYTICEETSPQISTVNSSSAALSESEPTPQCENKTYSETELHHRGIMQYVQTNPDHRDKNTDFHFVIENNPLSFPNSQDSYWTLEHSQGSSQLPRIESPKHQYPCQHDSSTARQSDHAKANKPMENIVASNISQEMQLEHFLKTLSLPITYRQGLDQTNSNQKSHDNYQLNFTQFGIDSIILENTSKPIHLASTQIESTTNEALDPDNKIQTLLDSNNGLPLSRDNPNCTYSAHAEGTDLESEINTVDIGDVEHGSLNPVPPGNDFYVKMNRKEWSRPTTESTINNEAHQNKDNSIGKHETTESNLSCFKDTSLTSTDIISENDSDVIREEIIGTIKANPHINIDGTPLGLSHSINHQAELETVNEESQHTSMSKQLTEVMTHDVELGSRRESVSTEAIHCDVSTEQHDIDRRNIAETAYHALKENQELDKSIQTLERSHQDGAILEHFNHGTTLPRYNEREAVAVENISHDDLISENSKTESSECNIRDNWTTKERKCDILTTKERKCDISTTKERKCDILTTKERKCDILTTKDNILDNLTREERNDNLATEDSTRDKLTPKERSHDFVTSTNNIAIPEESNGHRVRLEDISYDILLSEDKILDNVIRRESNHDYAIIENRQETLTNNNTSTVAMSLQNRKSEIVTNEHTSHGDVSNEHISHGVVTPSVRSSITMTLQQQTERSEPIVEATGQISDLFNLVETQNINTETTLSEGTENKTREINVDIKNLDQEHGKTKNAFQNFVLVQTIPLDGLEIKHLTKLVSDTDESFRLLNYEEMDHTRSNTNNEAAQKKGQKTGQTRQEGLIHDGLYHITSGEKEMNVSSLKEEDFILDTREDEELQARSQGSEQMNRQSAHVGEVNKNRRKEETLNQSTLHNVEFTGSDKHTETKQGGQKKEELNQDNLKENEINQDNLKENEINHDNLKGNETNQDNLKENKINLDNLNENKINLDNLKKKEINQDNLKENETNQDNLKENEINLDNLRDNEINKDNLKTKEHNHDDKKDEVIHQNTLKNEVIHQNSLKDEEINEDSLKEDEIDQVCLKGNTNYQNRLTDKVIYQGEIKHDSVIDENIQHVSATDENVQHVSATDENVQHVSATDENVQHVRVTDENIQHVSATDENIQHVSATDENIEHDSVTDENVQHVSATDENVQHVSVTDENIQHVSATDENVQHVSVTDENIQHDNTTDENIQHDSPTDENVQHVSATDENVQHVSATDENIQHVSATDENVQHVSATDENIQHDSPTDENVQHVSATDENVQHVSATDENVQHVSATDENIQHVSATNENIQHDNTTDENIHHDNTTNENIQHDNTTDKNIQHDSPTDENIQHDSSTDENVQHVSATDENVQHVSATDENVQHVSATDENIQHDNTTDENIQHDSSTDENIQHDNTTDENIQHDSSTNENIQHDNTTDENIQHDSPTDENIQHDSSTDENIQHDSATDENIQHDSIIDENIQHYSVKDENIQHDSATDENIQHDRATDENVQHDSVTDENIQHHRATDENVQHDSVTDENIQHDSVTDENIQHDSVADENIQHHRATDENIQHESATEENIQHDSITDQNIQHDSITDENIQHECVTDENIQHQSATDENIQHDSALDENIQHDSATDENIQHDSITDENIQHDSTTDENVQHDSITDENIQHDSIIDENIQHDSIIDENIQHDSTTDENIQHDRATDENIQHDSITDENVQHDSVTDENIQHDSATDENIKHERLTDQNINKVSTNEAQVDYDKRATKAADPACVVSEGAQTNQDSLEIKDKNNDQEIVKEETFNEEIKDSQVEEKILQHQYLEYDQNIDLKVGKKIVEIKNADGDQEIVEIKAIDFDIVKINDAEINQEIIEVKDAEVNQEIIEVKDEEANQEIIEVKDAEVDQEIIEVKDAEVNQEIIEVKDAEVNQEIIEVKDAEVNQEIIEVKDAEVNQEIIEVKDAEVNQEIIEVKDAEINQEIIEVKDAEVNQEIIEVKDAEVDQEIVEIKAIDFDIVKINDAEINQEIIEVKDAEVNLEIIEVKDAEVDQEIIEVKDAEVDQEIVEIKAIDFDIVKINDAEINQEIIELKDAEVNLEIIEVKDAEVDQEIIEVKDAEVDQEIIEVKDAEVNQEIIDNTIEIKDEDINLNENFEQNHTTKTIINQNDETKVINKDSTNLEQIQDISIHDELNQNYLTVEETTQEISMTKFTSSSHLPQEDNNYQNFISETMSQEIDATDKVEVMISQENDILKDMTHCENDMVDGDSQCYSDENTSEVRVSVNLIPSEASLNIETTVAQSSNSSEEQLNVCENIITESVQSLTRDWHDASETRMHQKQNKDNTKPDSLEATNYLMQDRSNIEAGAVTGLTADTFMQFNAAIDDSLCDFSHSFNITAHNSEDRDTPSHVSQISVESNMQEYSENLDIVFQSHLKEPISLSLNKDTLQERNESNSLSVNKDTLQERNESNSLSVNKDTLQEETDESDSLSLNKDTLQETKDNILEDKNIKRTCSIEEFETQFKSFHSEQKILHDKQSQTDPNTEITQTKTERESSTQTDQADENQFDHLAVSSFRLSQGPLSSETLQLDNIDGNADHAGLEAVSYTSSAVDEDVCAGNAQETNQNDSTEKCRATNWILPVYRGVCHSVTHPEMPFMG